MCNFTRDIPVLQGYSMCIVNDFGKTYNTSEDQELEVWIKANATNVGGEKETAITKFLVKNKGMH